MKTRVALVLLALSAMLGCSATARLYPTQGPLSLQTPSPVFVGRLTGAVNSGTVSFVMADGEVCKGRWARVVPATAGTPAANGMPSVWDTVYGSGYYVAHVLGKRYFADGAITGNLGTVLNVEFYRADPPATHIAGVAKDSKGNIYKMVFTAVGAT